MCQLHFTSITDDSKHLVIEAVVFWNKYETFQDQAWILDCWSITILLSSGQFMWKMWHVCEKQFSAIIIIYTPCMMNVSICFMKKRLEDPGLHFWLSEVKGDTTSANCVKYVELYSKNLQWVNQLWRIIQMRKNIRLKSRKWKPFSCQLIKQQIRFHQQFLPKQLNKV